MSDILGYTGKRVIVSDCFSGMGEATAKLLLGLGAEVHGFDYKDSTLPLASFNKLDLRDPASIEAGVAAVGGKVDALFNCAGLPGDAAGVVNGVVLPVDGGFMGGMATGHVDIGRMMGKAKEPAA